MDKFLILHPEIKKQGFEQNSRKPLFSKWCARPETYQYLQNPLKSLGLLKTQNQIFTNAIHFATQFLHI